MASNIVINVAAKEFINFAPTSAALIREQNNSVPTTLSYSNGIGQTMTTGQVLYSVGTSGTPGFLEVVVQTGVTLNGSGTVNLVVNSLPTATQANQTINFDFDQSNIAISLTYNSKPVTSDVNINLTNRGTHGFTTAEFVAAYTDFDSDAMAEIMATGNVDGYEYDINGTNTWVPYTAGTWIPVSNITRLRYVAVDQNAAYSKSNPWFAKDSQGNISQ
jgi:hypothetical protein